jgi:long-chain acyl-CoA synthetase
MTVSAASRSALNAWGTHPSFVELHPGSAPVRTSAEQSLRSISDLAAMLKSWGIRARQLVPLFLQNSIDFVHAFLALLELGAIPVLVKLEYRRMELDEIFANCRPQAVLSERYHLPLLKPYLRGMSVIERAEGRFGLSQAHEPGSPPADIPEEIATVNYTYRGSGYPLGAMVPHARYLHGARVLQDGLQGLAGEKMLVILPMAHIFTLVGCVLVPLLYGMTSVIACTLHPRHLFGYIEENRIDHLCSVPEIYELLYRVRDTGRDLSSLKTFVSGGSLLSAERYSAIRDAFSIDLLHGYGLTEFTPVSRNVRSLARAGTVGTVVDGVECRIDSPDAGGAGEIRVRTPSLADGYLRRASDTQAAFQDGWFRTGDLGRLEDGHLVVVKEMKQTRKVNGNLVDLEELRRAILTDREVSDCRVACENGGLSAGLAVAGRVDFERKSVELRARLRGLVAEYKIPRTIFRL